MAARWPSLVAMIIVVTASCGRSDYDPADPRQVAMRIFEVAREADPTEDELRALFGPVDELEERADLYDALEGLRAAEEPTVTNVETLADLDAVAIDLRAGLSGGGEAFYSLRLGREVENGPWTIRWFRGPGMQWPSPRNRRESGLTSSPPPI